MDSSRWPLESSADAAGEWAVDAAMAEAQREREDELAGVGAYGDPRRCERHPNQVTSSPDGMFDTPCPACEWEMDACNPERGEEV